MTRYREAGVDLEAADAVVASIAASVTATWNGKVVGGFGGFAAGLTLPEGFREPVLMLSTDGVGTKAEVARLARRYDGIGSDLVAMCCDDLVATGARPIAMTDYIAVGKIDQAVVAAIVSSVATACADAGVALVGGETAEHPDVMQEDAFDIAGTALGVVEAGTEITGSAIRQGDAIVGIDSPNFRSNGFSLLRKVVLGRLDLGDDLPGAGMTVADALLDPSVVYTETVLDVVASSEVHGCAHVTGGGLAANLARVLPGDVDARIDETAWQRPAVFDAVAELGGISADDMQRTFNLGIGFVLVVPADSADRVAATVAGHGRRAWQIGEITAGSGRATLGRSPAA